MKSKTTSLRIICLFFFFSIFFFFINSCKKSDPLSPYFIKCQISDTAAAFNYNALAGFYNTNQVTINPWTTDTITLHAGFGFFGRSNDSTRTFGISIQFFKPTTLSTGVYTDTDTNYSISASYSVAYSLFEPRANPGLYYQAVSGDGYRFTVNNGATLTNHLILNITSITSQTIKGTFSGDLYLDTYLPSGGFPEKVTINNASFYLKLNAQ